MNHYEYVQKWKIIRQVIFCKIQMTFKITETQDMRVPYAFPSSIVPVLLKAILKEI